jgi:hypothetical protein
MEKVIRSQRPLSGEENARRIGETLFQAFLTLHSAGFRRG